MWKLVLPYCEGREWEKEQLGVSAVVREDDPTACVLGLRLTILTV